MNAKVFDTEVLLNVAPDWSDRRDILEDFLSETRSDLVELERALKADDFPETVRLAHSIKGACSMIGAQELAQTCAALESLGRQCVPQTANNIKASFDRLASHLDTVVVMGGGSVALGRGMTVLVAEDHNFQRRTVVRMLNTLGVREVLEAKNGFEALGLLKEKGRVDLLICDLDMEQMDGMELIRNVGASDSVGAVIVLSGHERSILDTVAKMAHAYGVKLLGAIDKPLTLDRLQNILDLPSFSATNTPAGHQFSIEEIRHGIRQAQFEAFFQPKVSLANGLVVGAEALARWRHPEKGVIGPNAFIPPLEQAGEIEELTFLMLKRAVSACRGWAQQKPDISVSVNLSLTSLGDPALADQIAAITASAELDPSKLILEITETAAMKNVGVTLENFVRLRMRGFTLSIDDYGTGFASLQQLQLAPFSELKIDRSFVTGCAENAASRAIMESCVQMARQLGFRSVGEGVEVQADWDALRDAGCDLAQGFFIARPMPAEQFLTFLTRNTGL